MRAAAVIIIVTGLACQVAAPIPSRIAFEHGTRFHTLPGDLVIVNATVIDVIAGVALPDRTVVVRGQQIAAVARADLVDVVGGVMQVDGRGRYVMPGLADMHVHIWTPNDLVLFAAAGVTTVRNMAGKPVHLEWRDQIARGELFGPTIVTAGPILDGGEATKDNFVVKTAADAERAVLETKAAGYDFVKVHEAIAPKVYDAIVATAKRERIVFAGHAPLALGHVLDAGQRSIEHLTGYPRAILRDNASFAPNLSVPLGEETPRL